MNILPHKSWHVRTKKNIARVRRDEAKAAEEEKETQRKISLAAQEARTSFLRERAVNRLSHQINAGGGLVSAEQLNSSSSAAASEAGESSTYPPVVDTNSTNLDQCPIPLASLANLNEGGHINFFQDIESGKKLDYETNKEHEKEKKKEQDEYEKKIGYLVYIQDPAEKDKELPWFAKIGNRKGDQQTQEVIDEDKEKLESKSLKEKKLKDFNDPLRDIRGYLKISAPGGVKKLSDFGKVNFVKSSLGQPSQSQSSSATVSSKSKSTKSTILDHRPAAKDKDKDKLKKKKKEKKSKKSKKSKSKKHRKSKYTSTSSNETDPADSDDDRELQRKKTIEKLRAERLEREREERRKAEKVMAKLRGEDVEEKTTKKSKDLSSEYDTIVPNPELEANPRYRKQQYNSQFNPHLARQNYD